MDFTRQLGILHPAKVVKRKVTLIGAGAIGSFAALALTKLGVENLTVYDNDMVEEHNLPNQFYRVKDEGSSKVSSLAAIVNEFNGVAATPINGLYTKQKLDEFVVVATDSMISRKKVFEQFCKQKGARYLIEARMGGELGYVYCVDKQNKDQMKAYKGTLYTDKEAAMTPCTRKAIIYNVLMISSLICRAFKALVNEEKSYPFENIFDMRNMMFYSQPAQRK